MRHERAPGPTFEIGQLGFIDFETKGRLPISVGTDRYARNAQATMLAWAIGDGPVNVNAAPDDRRAFWYELAPEFQAFFDRVMVGEAWFVAHNAGFDRAIWNHATHGFPRLEPHHIIDTRVQAVASGLPPALDAAARFATGVGKDSAGKDLIRLFTLSDSSATAETHPEEWARFVDYAKRDVEAMRDLFKHTRQLPIAEWKEYWAAERINERGVAIDIDLVQAAANMAIHDRRISSSELTRLTNGAVTSVDQVQRLSAWLLDVLPSDGRDIMIKRLEETDEDGTVTRPQKTTLDREQVEKLIAYLESLPPLSASLKAALRVLQIRLYGGSKTPAKFGKLLLQQHNAVIRNQYVFNGASQTGRFCVDADTMIDTPLGPRRIVDLEVGHLVVGGSGLFRKVVAQVYKGLEPMYRLSGPRGAFVVATAGHRIMTESGWKRIDECFKKTVDGRFLLRRSCTPVSVPDLYDDRHMCTLAGIVPHSARGTGEDVGRDRVSSFEERGVLAQQDSEQEPDVRREDGGGAYFTRRPDGSLEWRWLHVRTPEHPDDGTWTVVMAERYGSASYRRRQDEQRAGQLSSGNKTRSPVSAQAATWTLVSVGERGVWDISVDRDESYVAQGLIHHNSARGVQIHNLIRDAAPYEIDAIDALTGGISADDFALLGGDDPISRKLSLLIRPVMIAEPGKAFVWGDWANIEARLLPWLTKDPEAEQRLEIFRAVDRDPSIPDLYTRTAATLSGVPVEDVDKKMRQRGKVTELALGFGGSTAALMSMAGSFGLHLTEVEAKATVERWRQANRWAYRFWGRHNDREGSFGLWGALNQAIEQPRTPKSIGRVTYLYLPEYLGGSLLCLLPSGRFITYSRIRWEMVDIKDDDDKMIDRERQLRFSRDMGRVKFWPGLAAENCIQACAADLLRATIVRLNDDRYGWMPVRLHTHDEILVETDEVAVDTACRELLREMEAPLAWTTDLPIKADATVARWYSKSEGSWGL